jgi:transcriptional regulator
MRGKILARRCSQRLPVVSAAISSSALSAAVLLLRSDRSAATFCRNPTEDSMPAADQPDVLRGTLDLLILKTLTLEPMHGWGISARIQQFSRGILDVNQGSLYPALQRLEQRGWIDSEWRTSENNRRAKYYRLTASGRRAVGAETASWRRYVEAVELILGIA